MNDATTGAAHASPTSRGRQTEVQSHCSHPTLHQMNSGEQKICEEKVIVEIDPEHVKSYLSVFIYDGSLLEIIYIYIYIYIN